MIGTRAIGGPALVAATDPRGMQMGGPLASPTAPPAGGGGLWDRIKTELHKPGVAAALFRSGAATMQGGLGAGLSAAAGYMDDQKGIAAKAEQQQFQNDMAMRGMSLDELRAQQTNDLGWAGVTNDASRNQEVSRHNRAGETIDANGQRIQLHGIDTSAATQRRGQDVQVATNAADNATSRANNAASVEASRYGTDAETYRSGRALAAGIGSKDTYRETQITTPGAPAVSSIWGSTPAVPKTVTTTRAPLGTAGDEIRYDASGRAFRRDPATGKPVPVR